MIQFPTLPIVCCCTTLKNATAYTSSQKLLNKSAMHAIISLLLQSRKFWWYLLLASSMLLHDVMMTSCCCQRYAVSVNDFVSAGQCIPAHRAARMQQLNCHVKKRQTFFCGLRNRPDLSPVDYEIWAVMQHRVYHRQIHSVNELKRRSSTVDFYE